MPYEIRRRGRRYCVYKVGTNDRFGCHRTRRAAGRQIGAIEANEKAVDLVPTQAMQRNACAALERRREVPASRRGMRGTGLARARDICNGRNLSPETVRTMRAWFARHRETSRNSPNYADRDAAWQAWNGWGGDEGEQWAERKVRELDKQKALASARVGDFVSWAGGGDAPTYGEITEITDNGTISVPDSDFTLDAGEDDPAALMRVYRRNADGEWTATNDYAARRLSRLNRAEKAYMPGHKKLPQNVANYVAVGDPPEICGACHWYGGEGKCHLVEGTPRLITALGGCDYWQDAEEVIVEPPFMLNYDVDTLQKPTVWQRLFGKTARETRYNAFQALGDGLWIAHYTNNFEDREGEILSDKAHTRYAARVQAGLIPMPELWILHIPGTRIGQTEWIEKLGHVMVAVGRFDDTPAGKAMEQFFLQHDHVAFETSHGFYYPVWAKRGGVIEEYNTYEVTVAWPGEAANPYMSMDTILGVLGMNDKAKAELRRRLGQAADTVIQQMEAFEELGERIRESGARHKAEWGDVTDDPQQDDKADKPQDADVLNLVLEQQGELLTALTEFMDGQAARDKAMTDRLQRAETLAETLTNELIRPPEAAPVEEPDATEAREKLKEDRDTVPAYDPVFGDMQVPQTDSNGNPVDKPEA